MSDAWYYASSGNRVGPLSKVDLVQALSSMPEPAETLVWKSGFSGWRKALDVSELFAYVAKPPPLPSMARSMPPPLKSLAATTQSNQNEHGINVFNALFGFRGRLNRTQYALIFLVAYLGPLVITGVMAEEFDKSPGYVQIVFLGLIVWMFWVFFASLAKRLHDMDKPATYCLFVFVPIVGFLTVLICFFAQGTPGANQYGQSP